MGGSYELRHIAGLLALALALLLPSGPGRADDSDLFSTAVTPNVMLYVDNSGSMNNTVWHPAFDPTKPSSFYGCTYWADDGGEEYYTVNSTVTRCTRSRTIFYDPTALPDSTRWSHRYLNWYFSNATNAIGTSGLPIYQEVFATNNGTNGTCAVGLGAPATYGKYRRTRVTAVQDVLRNVICDVNAAGEVRFGLAQFRRVSTSNDANGGYVLVPVNDYKWDHDGNPATPKIPYTYTLNGVSRTHEAHLKSAIIGLDGESMTPLGEGLFQLYTYFMSRTDANRPFGKDGVTRFPKYVYKTDDTSGGSYGGTYSSSGAPTVPDSPVQYTCQKNFVIILTDGEPTMDRFSIVAPTNATAGFADFKTKLIGDYNPDNTNPEAGNEEPACVTNGFNYLCADYLDDIAKFMHDKDFRPDMAGNQTFDIYTVGFTTGTNTPADYLLRKTASVGGGTAYSSNDPDALADAIVNSLADIVQKSQAFTAATVPATRTSSGGNFYTSLFVPYESIPYWEGHLKSFQLAANGDILDSNGVCAVDDPVVGQCKSGPFKTTAVPYWDAGQQVPGPATRKLLTSVSNARTNFDMASISAANLTLAAPPSYPPTAYTGSTATSVEGLADEIVQNVRGCVFGTGVSTNVSTPSACTARPWLLGDIFHSNPVVVGSPSAFLNEASYSAFASNATYATRKRVIYAGANDGFLRGFDAGTYQAAASPPGYDRGTGTEIFGFMPWSVRQKIKDLPLKTNRKGFYLVDGSPAVADVWFYPTATTTTKAISGSEWKTVLIGGLREGGKGYYALDITDPASGSYPGYLWEFPQEGAAGAADLALLGESWSDPVITRVRVKIGSGTYERWVAVVGGGYSVTGDPNNVGYSAAATEGRGLFMIDLASGRLLAKKVFGASTGQVPDMRYAIPSTPAVLDLDFDGFADVIYVGDLGGNMWKWVVNAAGDDPINSSGNITQPSWPFKKFFTTPGVVVGSSTFYKSVFYPPAATYVNKQLWLAWGTGERTNLRFADPATTSTADNNRLYAMSDADPYESLVLATLTESDLDGAPSATTCNPPTGGKPGYYVVAANSEKFVTNVEVFASYIFAGSFTPTSTTDPCSSGGTAALYVVRIQCGSGFFGADISPTPRRLTLGAGMPTDPRLSISSDGGSSDSNRVIVNKQQGDVSNIVAPPIPSGGAGVLYWRERP